MRFSPAQRRYNRHVLILSLAYGVLLIGAELAFKQRLIGSPLTYATALLPALPIIGMFAAIGRYLVDERDEYLRMLMVRQSLVASGFALSCATIWGFLESFDLVLHLDSYWVAVAWFGGLGIGDCVNRIIARREARADVRP